MFRIKVQKGETYTEYFEFFNRSVNDMYVRDFSLFGAKVYVTDTETGEELYNPEQGWLD